MAQRRTLAIAASALLGALISTPAYAHFVLKTPKSYSEQDFLGDPQKSQPCGQADPGGAVVPTGMVTTLEAGSTVDIEIDETIFHPGHYRVSLAMNQAALPNDPPVTAGSSACGSTIIEAHPTMPLLADGLLKHTNAFSAPQTMHVQLPPGVTCDHCTLQITEFMSNHPLNNPGGCYYHHCATVSIVPAGSAPDAGPATGPDAAPGPGPDAAPGPGPVAAGGGVTDPGASGCGCRVPSRRSSSSGVLLGGVVLGLLALRRRRRSS